MHRSVSRIACTILVLFLLSLVAGCQNRDSKTPVDLSCFQDIQSGGEWAVITEPYAAFHERPDPTSNVAAHGRLGDIAKVTGKSIIPDSQGTSTTIWYQFESGFVPESSVIIYPNMLKAQTASKELQENSL